MEIYHDTQDLRLHDTAVAIGVFDGVHLGHQAVLHQVAAFARLHGLSSAALTFDIHPAALLAPERAPATISTLSRRMALMEEYGGGLNAIVTESFTPDFAALSPDEFIQKILITRLGARHVFVGADFRYGKNRAGDVHTLSAEGANHLFSVTIVPPVVLDGARVSSTRVRTLVAKGDLPAAVKLLGHPFAVAGRVVAGKKLGRELGFPTANLVPLDARQLLPADGVYAGYAVLAGDAVYRAAISVGTNPTTDADGGRKVEAFIMDGYEGDLYDREIDLDFRARIRGQITFDGLDPLKRQIQADVSQVENLVVRKQTG